MKDCQVTLGTYTSAMGCMTTSSSSGRHKVRYKERKPETRMFLAQCIHIVLPLSAAVRLQNVVRSLMVGALPTQPEAGQRQRLG